MNNVNAAKTSSLMYNRTAPFCYFIESESSATNVNSRKLVKILMQFVQYLLLCLCNIFISISCIYVGIDVISRMNNVVNNIEFHPTVSHDLQCYNVSFLKLSQLLVHGDVESNPGPVGNRSTQKGSQKKKKTFNFNRKKEDKVTIDPISHNVDPIVLNETCAPEHAVTYDIVEETDTTMDIDPIVVHERCEPKHVGTTSTPNVICASCNKKITVTDPTSKTITCVHCKARSKVSKLKFAVMPDIVEERDKSMDIDPIVLDESGNPKHVDTSGAIDVICASCSKNITVTDPTSKTITCVHCKATSKVSKLKAAVTPDIVDETDKSMDIDTIGTPKWRRSKKNFNVAPKQLDIDSVN